MERREATEQRARRGRRGEEAGQLREQSPWVISLDRGQKVERRKDMTGTKTTVDYIQLTYSIWMWKWGKACQGILSDSCITQGVNMIKWNTQKKAHMMTRICITSYFKLKEYWETVADDLDHCNNPEVTASAKLCISSITVLHTVTLRLNIEKNVLLCHAPVKISWHNICNICCDGRGGHEVDVDNDWWWWGVKCIRDSHPLSVGIVPLNWFVGLSGLTRRPIYSNSRSLPGRLGTHLAKQRVVRMHKHTPAKAHKWCAVMYKCTVTADCWFYSLYASGKEALTQCFRFHRMVLHQLRCVLSLTRETDWNYTEWLTGPTEKENIIIF